MLHSEMEGEIRRLNLAMANLGKWLETLKQTQAEQAARMDALYAALKKEEKKVDHGHGKG